MGSGQEFQLYVIRAQALRKVFASIKGYYFQACGQWAVGLDLVLRPRSEVNP